MPFRCEWNGQPCDKLHMKVNWTDYGHCFSFNTDPNNSLHASRTGMCSCLANAPIPIIRPLLLPSSSSSSETTLVHIHNDLLCGVERESAVALVLLDLSSAFHTVDHQSFLQLLESHFGIKGQVLQLLRSYLDGRMQCVAIENVQSKVVSLIYGVPQGSVLGLAKFTM